ncbi:hypothetical protein [Pseudomonas sp. Sample_11]|uniref:hypothetical protein n=1 Tax=Pseudomonas sp. Sample_11 TaxID=2448261 RepID=UPI001032E02C|nr:hypothetical protein [Pseudomonas sp. Sample_11]
MAALSSLNALHFKYRFNERFEHTGEMTVNALYPEEAYAQYLLVEPVYDIMLAAAHQTTLKMYGGRSDSSFADIASEQVEAFEGLKGSLAAHRAELDDSKLGLSASIDQFLQHLQSQYEQVAAMAAVVMTKHIGEEPGQSEVNNYRALVGMGPKELNNIKPPRIIEKNLADLSKPVWISRPRILDRKLSRHRRRPAVQADDVYA